MPQEKCEIHGKDEQVVVKICTESGLSATPFCPPEKVVTQSFTKGAKEPSSSPAICTSYPSGCAAVRKKRNRPGIPRPGFFLFHRYLPLLNT